MSHWYDKNGQLVLDATVKDARKLCLYPSVTSVYKIIENYGLNLWKQRQAALAGYTYPKSNLDEKEVVNAIIQDGMDEAAQKADWGTKIHNMIANYLLLPGRPKGDGNMKIAFDAVASWIDDNVVQVYNVEKSCVNETYRFAGTPDLNALMIDNKEALIDWKSQATKNGKFTKYKEWAWQLAGCNFLINRRAERWINVAISSNEPGLIKVFEWKKEHIAEAEGIFLIILDLFNKLNKLEG